jgi:uncharacterized membrane protein SpoIIM required for sporulation
MDSFVARHRENWEDLEALLARRRVGAPLAADEIEDLVELYRSTMSDLAIARRDYGNDEVVRFLEQLVNRAHLAVYRRQRGSWREVWTFFTIRFPREVRATASYALLAFALFTIPLLAAMLLTLLDPLTARIVIPSRSFVDRVESGQSWLVFDPEFRGLLATIVMTNNIRVAFMAFAGGITFGIGTTLVLIWNGLQIGATVGAATSFGLGRALGSFVVAHGGVEFIVIWLSGGVGLRIGHRMLAPGLVTRLAAMTQAARDGARVMAGCVPLLILAGLLEGFVSPSDLMLEVKVAIGLAASVAVIAFLALRGRAAQS